MSTLSIRSILNGMPDEKVAGVLAALQLKNGKLTTVPYELSIFIKDGVPSEELKEALKEWAVDHTSIAQK